MSPELAAVLQLLQRLTCQLATLPEDDASRDRLEASRSELVRLVPGGPRVPWGPLAGASSADRRELKREVLALARALSQDLLQRMPERVVDAVALEQINTAIDAACTILRMAVAWDEQGLGLTPQEAGQVACGLGPVFLGGKSVLAALTIRALPTAAPPGSTAEAQACLHSLASIVRNELAAADDVLRLLVIAGQPAGMQLFADTVVVDTVLKWITAVSQALAVLLAAPPPQGGDYGLRPIVATLGRYASVLSYLLSQPPMHALARALAASQPCQKAVVSLLLGPLLARVAAQGRLGGASRGVGRMEEVAAPPAPAGAAARAANVVHVSDDSSTLLGILANIGRLVWLGTADEARPGTPVLQSAIRRRMRQPGGAPASMRHTVDALLLLPVERPADMSSSLWGQLVTSAAGLLCAAASAISTVADSNGAGLALDSALRGPNAAALKQDQHAAAWELLRLLPHWADLVRTAAADATLAPADLVSLLNYTYESFFLLLDQAQVLASAQQAATLVAATVAWTRLLPLLLRLDERWRTLDASRPTPLQLAGRVWEALFFDGTVRISNWFSREVRLAEALAGSGSGALPLPPKLPQQLWQLHTLGCRVMHWVAGCRTHQLLPTGGASVDWRIFRELPNFQLMAAIKASLMAEHAGTQGCSEKQRQAMCVAHHAAMAAAAAVVDTLQPLPSHRDAPRDTQRVGGTFDALLCMASFCPQLLEIDPLIIDRLVDQLTASNRPLVGALMPLAVLVSNAMDSPRLAAAIIASPLPAFLLGAGPRLRREAASVASGAAEAVYAQQHCWTALVSLNKAAAQVFRQLSTADQEAPDTQLVLDLAAAANAHGQRLAAVAPHQGGQAALAAAGAPRAARLLRQMLGEAAQLAAVVQRWLALPPQQAAVRLELAQAAAARSCANLACAQLERGGGPAAGKGAGSRKCSGCCTAWYCDEACSQADWKPLAHALPPHKRCCKELAAARLAARQQAAAG